MHKVAFFVACLVCIGHGRSVQVVSEQPQSDEYFDQVDYVPNSKSLAEVDQSNSRVDREGGRHQLKKILMLFLTLNPAAQYGRAGQIQESRPWYSLMFTAGIVDAMVQAVKLVRRMDQFPIVSSAIVALTVLAHYFQDKAYSIYDYAMQPSVVWQKRFMSSSLLLSSFLHVSLEHLVEDSSALLSYGTLFEDLLPPDAFLQLITYALLAPNALLVLGTKLWVSRSSDPAAIAAHESAYVDFAGTLMCLVTVFRSHVLAPAGQKHSVHGISVPIEYAWLDMLTQKLANPQMPVVRELSGLVAGLLWVYSDKLRKDLEKKLSRKQKRLIMAGAVLAGVLAGVLLLSD